MTRHYLDHASTSPARQEAIDAMTAWLRSPSSSLLHGDPSRVHAEGHAARVAIEAARDAVAALVGARNSEIVFTASATEAIAMAAGGVAERGGHQVVPAIEHSAVRKCAQAAGSVTVVGCDRHGVVDPDEVEAALRPDTALVHLQWGNHEVGTLQPVAEVVARCHAKGVLVHIDAAQAAGRVPIDVGACGADLLSMSAHKMGGPPGIGALYVRRRLRLRPLVLGGDQERARRAGFENGPAIVGWGAVAAGLSVDIESARSRALTDRLVAGVADLDGVEVLGHPTARLPHLVCLAIDGVEPQGVLLGLDQRGIAAHSGSACSSEAIEPSPVLEAMGVDAQRSLRLSVGWSTTEADVDAALHALPAVLAELRALGRPPR